MVIHVKTHESVRRQFFMYYSNEKLLLALKILMNKFNHSCIVKPLQAIQSVKMVENAVIYIPIRTL